MGKDDRDGSHSEAPVSDDDEFTKWRKRTSDLLLAFRLRAEIEAQEILQAELDAELERAKAAVARWLEQAPLKALGRPH